MQVYLAYGVLGGVLVLFLALVLFKAPVKTDNFGNNSESLNYLIQVFFFKISICFIKKN